MKEEESFNVREQVQPEPEPEPEPDPEPEPEPVVDTDPEPAVESPEETQANIFSYFGFSGPIIVFFDLIPLPTPLSTSYLLKHFNLIQFLNWSLYIYFFTIYY